MNKLYSLQNLTDTYSLGAEIWNTISPPFCVFLEGDLGAGKTTLCQAIIEAAGYKGPVTSPTYNLIQEYHLEGTTIFHMDLYRLNDPEELEFLGLADLWNDTSVFLIEWPEKGQGFLPQPDSTIVIKRIEDDQSVNQDATARSIEITLHT